ncbi:4804_t:CDS:2, partial [Ambispora gerdemannii]
KSTIENNSNLTTPEQKKQAQELLKLIITAELLVKEQKFNPQILSQLIKEKNNNTPSYQLLNKERRAEQLKKEIKVGVSGKDLDKLARQLMAEEKVQSSSLNYKGFSAAICVSLNEELTHGIPDERVFKDGDLVSIDVACNYQDIGAMLEKYIKNRGYHPIKEYGGHGIGEKLHQEPFIPNYKTPNKGEIIKEGNFICIEPLVQIGDAEVDISANKWTTNKEFFSVEGKVIELIYNKRFRVECKNGKIITADVANRFRNEQGWRRAKIVVGDRVVVEVVLGDLEKGQIVSFEKKE